MHILFQKIKSFFKRELPEFILIDKPKGITSFGVIRKLQQKFGYHKMGHAGTLDPNATGLLLVATGKGTKKLRQIVGFDKVYEAEILLGRKTDTGDIVGKTIEEKPVPDIDHDKVKAVLESVLGTHEFTVPAYAAIKVHGKPLYKYARQGKHIKLPKKFMTITSAEIVTIHPSVLVIVFCVSSGTYIRTLAEIIGERLGTVATLQNLRRLKIGDFDLKQAVKI